MESGKPILLQAQPELLVHQFSGHKLFKLDCLILPLYAERLHTLCEILPLLLQIGQQIFTFGQPFQGLGEGIASAPQPPDAVLLLGIPFLFLFPPL